MFFSSRGKASSAAVFAFGQRPSYYQNELGGSVLRVLIHQRLPQTCHVTQTPFPGSPFLSQIGPRSINSSWVLTRNQTLFWDCRHERPRSPSPPQHGKDFTEWLPQHGGSRREPGWPSPRPPSLASSQHAHLLPPLRSVHGRPSLPTAWKDLAPALHLASSLSSVSPGLNTHHRGLPQPPHHPLQLPTDTPTVSSTLPLPPWRHVSRSDTTLFIYLYVAYCLFLPNNMLISARMGSKHPNRGWKSREGNNLWMPTSGAFIYLFFSRTVIRAHIS